MKIVILAWGGLALAALTGCCCPQAPTCGAAVVGPVEGVAPADPFPAANRVAAWDYLAKKHDRDRDGVITATEYDRGEATFKRLDRDGDGRLTRSDLAHGPIHGLIVQMMLMRYFQADDNPRDLHREEVATSFRKADANGDGGLSSPELAAAIEAFHAASEKPVARMPGGMDPHDSFVLEAGTPGAHVVTLAQLTAWFTKHAGDDGIWTMPTGHTPSSGPARPDGIAQGETAQDFSLQPPGGGADVMLSSFRGAKPVALIFGSYT